MCTDLEDLYQDNLLKIEESKGIENLLNQLINSHHGQNLFQGLLYQKKCLIDKGIAFNINIDTDSSYCGTKIDFSCNNNAFEAKITLDYCSTKQEFLTMERPILIQYNGWYRLYTLEIPVYILLAHELLHALNHAELLAKKPEATTNYENKLESLNRRKGIQTFLIEKLNLQKNHFILQEPYKSLWENPYTTKEDENDIGDSLDEMTTLLGSLHEISEKNWVIIGETYFLREHYKSSEFLKNLIPWSHYNAKNFYINKDDNSIFLLEDKYIETVLNIFGLVPHQTNSQNYKLPLAFCPSDKFANFKDLEKSKIYAIKKPSRKKTCIKNSTLN